MKLAKVILDIQSNKFSNAFSYAICDGNDGDIFNQQLLLQKRIVIKDEDIHAVEVGSMVVVPFGKQLKLGFLIEISDDDESINFEKKKLKPIVYAVTRPYFSAENVEFAKFISTKYVASFASCLRLFLAPGSAARLRYSDKKYKVEIHKYRKIDDKFLKKYLLDAFLDNNNYENFTLTNGQKNALDKINNSLEHKENKVFVLDGVTGSGKTEVYLRSIAEVLKKGKTACVLVPEISLTPQTVSRFYQRFGKDIAVLHSKMTKQELNNQYEKISNEQVKIVVGARSALFSPLKNIGIIVIDEEHENSYKQDKTPKYHARDCAERLAVQQNAVLVLGSATPSIESIYNSKIKDNWELINLPERTNKAQMPKIEVVDMGLEFKGGYKNLFSRKLESEIINTLKSGNKVVLFHNRRGYANYMFCRSCGYTPICPNCSVSLTYHQRMQVQIQTQSGMQTVYKEMLSCHHCGQIQEVPVKCPECDSPYIAKFGAGTQSVEDQLSAIVAENALFNTRIIRMDADTTKGNMSHQTCIEEFSKPGPAVLLGTQMITKGLDFNDVTLVGVVLADTNLTLPDFRSAERTFNLILQVAGRAGRADLPGKVLVQTYMPEAESIICASQYQKDEFLSFELNKRKMLNYPPFSSLVNVVVSGKDEDVVSNFVNDLYIDLCDYVSNNDIKAEIMPATQCVLQKLRNMFRYHILLKLNNPDDASLVASNIQKNYNKNNDVNVSIDIDPISIL